MLELRYRSAVIAQHVRESLHVGREVVAARSPVDLDGTVIEKVKIRGIR